MTCFAPLHAWQNRNGGPIAFGPSKYHDKQLQLACGQCIGCRLEHSRQWATRCMHEASGWTENSFITLTYDEENLPWDESLNKTHFQDFMKRLRSKLAPKKIRYFHCGEYGEKLKRPHYHALIFGHDWADKELWNDREGIQTFTSKALSKIWKWGFCTTGTLNWETAAYCCRYSLKKRTGKDANAHYVCKKYDDFEIQMEPEYVTMSLKPAIGKAWYGKYKDDCYPSDFITHKGSKYRVPKYYDKLLEAESPGELAALKEKRKQQAWKWNQDNTPARLRTRETCARARLANLPRTLEGLK